MEQVDIIRTRSFMVNTGEMKRTCLILGLLGSLRFGMRRQEANGDVSGKKV